VVWNPGEDTHESFEHEEEQTGQFLLTEAARSEPIAGLPAGLQVELAVILTPPPQPTPEELALIEALRKEITDDEDYGEQLGRALDAAQAFQVGDHIVTRSIRPPILSGRGRSPSRMRVVSRVEPRFKITSCIVACLESEPDGAGSRAVPGRRPHLAPALSRRASELGRVPLFFSPTGPGRKKSVRGH
jgi:hypothetical protein